MAVISKESCKIRERQMTKNVLLLLCTKNVFIYLFYNSVGERESNLRGFLNARSTRLGEHDDTFLINIG